MIETDAQKRHLSYRREARAKRQVMAGLAACCARCAFYDGWDRRGSCLNPQHMQVRSIDGGSAAEPARVLATQSCDLFKLKVEIGIREPDAAAEQLLDDITKAFSDSRARLDSRSKPT